MRSPADTRLPSSSTFGGLNRSYNPISITREQHKPSRSRLTKGTPKALQCRRRGQTRRPTGRSAQVVFVKRGICWSSPVSSLTLQLVHLHWFVNENVCSKTFKRCTGLSSIVRLLVRSNLPYRIHCGERRWFIRFEKLIFHSVCVNTVPATNWGLLWEEGRT